MRITYEELLKRFPWLTEEQKEKLRLLYQRLEAEEKDPSLKNKYTSVSLQKEGLRLWSGI